MGGAHRRDHADTAHYLLKVCASLHRLPYSFLILMAWRVADGASLFYTTPQPTTLNVLRQYALHVLFVPPAPAPDGALDGTAAPMRNPFPFVYKPNTLDRDRIVVPAGWDSWGKIAVLRDGFDAKAWGEAWEGDLSSDAGIDLDGEAGARKLYASLVQDQGPKVRAPSSFENTKILINVADPAPTPQQSDARTSLSREELRRERAARGSRSAWDLPHSHRRVRAAGRRPRRALGLVVLLAADSRACAGGDGGRQHGRHAWRPRPRQARGRANVAYPGERAEPDGTVAARGAAELLQEPVKYQGPHGEPRHLGGEPWCYSWEAPADRAEDVG